MLVVRTTTKIRDAAAAAALALPFAAMPALAQDAPTQTQDAPAQTQQGQQPAGQQTQAGQQALQPETLVATVGDAEVRGSDVLSFIGALPEPIRRQQPEMLVSLAVQQLVLRELILQEAMAQNLGEDPEVQALTEGAAQGAQEDAMVQVWLQRELQNQVTDEAVQQTYDALQGQSEQELPPLDQVRPQVEELLRRQAIGTIRADLQQGADITFYGPGGQPMQPQTAPAGGDQSQTGETAGAGTDTGAATGTGTGTDTGTDATQDQNEGGNGQETGGTD